MILTEKIFNMYKEQTSKASPAKIGLLDNEVKSLCQWADRRKEKVESVSYRWADVMRLVEHEGRIYEIPMEQLEYNLEGANTSLLGQVDERIVEAFKKIKKAGFKQPSTALYGRLFHYLCSEKAGKKYANKIKNWSSIQLVLRRMENTIRIALRFEDPDSYSPMQVCHDDGSVDFVYGRAPWRKELVKRGVIPRRKKR